MDMDDRTDAPDRRTRRLAGLALAGIAVYVVLHVALALLPPHYDPVSQPESDYAVGPYGWVMSVAFVLRGALSLAVVEALRRRLPERARSRTGLALLAVWAFGAFVLAAFPTDVAPAPATLHGRIHLAAAFVAFTAGALGTLRLSVSLPAVDAFRPRATVVRALAGLACAAFALVVLAAAGERVPALAPLWAVFGLVERLFLACVLAWVAVVAGVLAVE